MDRDGDESLFNIINTFTAGIELDDSDGGRSKENGKMFSKHNAFALINGNGGRADNAWSFSNKKSMSNHNHHVTEVAGSVGNSDKSLSSFGSESNDSNGGELNTGPSTESIISNCLTDSFVRQFRENSQSPGFFGFSSSNSSSPSLSQNSGVSSASSLSEAATTSTLKFNNSMGAAATQSCAVSSNSFMTNSSGSGSTLLSNGSNLTPTSFNSMSSFAQAVAKNAFDKAAPTSPPSSTSGNINPANLYDNVFGTVMSSSHNIIDPVGGDSFSSLLSGDLANMNNSLGGGNMSMNGSCSHGQQQHHQQQQQQPLYHQQQQQTNRRFSAQNSNNGSLLPTSFSQESLPHFFQNTSNFSVFNQPPTSSSTGATLPSLSNNRKLSLFNANLSNVVTGNNNATTAGSSNSSLSSPIFTTPQLSTANLFNGSGLDSPSMMGMNQAAIQAKFENHMRTLTNEINNTMQLYLSALAMRKEQLVKQMDHIRNAYMLMISQNKGKLLEKMPIHAIRFTHPDQTLFKSITSLGFLYSPAFGPYCQATGEGLGLSIEGDPTCFMVNIKNCFNEDILTGGDTIEVDIQPLEMVGQQPNSSLMPQMLSNIQKNILDNNNGNYNVTYIIPRGSCIRSVKISININGLPVANSPFHAVLKKERVGEYWKRIAIFGEEGSDVGKFCRPWGVAISPLPLKVDPAHKLEMSQNIPIHSKPFYNWSGSVPGRKDFLLAVADRSNNRIQFLKLSVPENEKRDVFGPPGFGSQGNSNGGGVEISVIHMFGSGPGTRPGQFDRPAGIAINANLGHIVVADKDNHRVQVFDLAGNFQFKFGEKGSRAGQFCYPWDVAICPQTSLILVSDTRNRRIQLFTHYGQYLWHCGQPLDSPRGVAFLTPERYIVSDFNKHRLLIIEKNDNRMSVHNTMPMQQRPDDLVNSKYIGFGEGSAWGEFLRPQGIIANITRNFSTGKPAALQVICADSRNNRIAFWNSVNQNFEYIGEDSLKGDSLSPTCFDRPSGIAMSGNILAVVDFGFNRIQIFQKSIA